VKSRKVGADAGVVDAKIAAPMARRGAHVDATSRARLGDPNDDVVGEAHPKASLARLDAACRGIGFHDRPAHLLRCRERKRERLLGRERERQRGKIGITALLAQVIAMLVNPNSPVAERMIGDVGEAARAKGLQLHVLKAGNESEIDAAFASLVQLKAGALVFVPDPFFNSRRDQLAALASHYAVPSIYASREFATAGGLISYGPSLTGIWRQVGIYAGRILGGAKPADLPVQQPATFELVVNLKTANTLGLTVPPSILARADEVIE